MTAAIAHQQSGRHEPCSPHYTVPDSPGEHHLSGQRIAEHAYRLLVGGEDEYLSHLNGGSEELPPR